MLNRRWLLETIGVDSTEQFFGDFHGIERVDGLIPVGVDVGISKSAWEGFPPVVGLLWLIAVVLVCSREWV